MWKSMSKGELFAIYLIWLLTAVLAVAVCCYKFGIGQDLINSKLPESVVTILQGTSGADTASAVTTSTGATLKDTIITTLGGNVNNVGLVLGAYVLLASVVYWIVASVKQRVSGIYFVGLFLHIGLIVILLVAGGQLLG